MIDAIVVILILMGLFFFLGTSVGLLRFPDFYTRMHAAGKGDTLSTSLLLLGLALYNLHNPGLGAFLVSCKIMFIGVAVFIASPTATHAIMDAGYEIKLKMWRRRKDPDEPYTGEERRKGAGK